MHRNAAGEEIPCEISLVRLPSSGRNLVRASIVDISERKHAVAEIHKLNAELELRVKERTAQLEAANRDLESFTYSVSHDLRAPLRHMDGFSRILVEEYGPQLPPGAKQHLERVRAASLHMGQLVDDLLNLARVGRGSLRIVTSDLNELVAETIQSLEAETRDSAVNWRVGRLSPAQCDPGLIRQVFFNLLSNALKFTRQREKAIIEIGEIGNQHDPVIFVRDNGVGFDMKYADKLFQVFQRLHGEEEFEGTGVGLAIVYRILQKHGGAIRAESSPWNGATFFFTVSQPLPALPAPVAVLGGAA
jgi:light-regulated signal transduction histidine kinase (bacteriophytochrome)